MVEKLAVCLIIVSYLFYNSTINSRCSSLDGFDMTHSEYNGVADWRRKGWALQQHPEHCAILDQVFFFILEKLGKKMTAKLHRKQCNGL